MDPPPHPPLPFCAILPLHRLLLNFGFPMAADIPPAVVDAFPENPTIKLKNYRDVFSAQEEHTCTFNNKAFVGLKGLSVL